MLERQGLLRVTGLVDSHPPHAATMQSSFPRAALHTDLEEALKSGQSVLTLILSPVHLHADQAILALQHKNHVLCEKPMATTAAKCAEMMAAAQAAERVLAIAMIRRFFPAFAQLKALLVAGEIGEVRSYTYREGKVFDWDVKTPAGFTKQAGGGAGLLFDIGPHAIDCLTWLFGIPHVVSCADDALAGVEGNVLLELEASGIGGLVQLSWDFPLRNELRVVGSKGELVLRVDQFDRLAIKKAAKFQEVVIDQAYPADVTRPGCRAIIPRLYTESMYCQLIQVIRAIRLGEPPAVGADMGKECVQVLESARRCAQPLDMPWLDPEEQSAYRALHWTNA
jgi:predicted dehydrogenase